jgi:hypothetical protein
MSALPPKADFAKRDWDVRFVPIADIVESMPRTRPASLDDVSERGNSALIESIPAEPPQQVRQLAQLAVCAALGLFAACV